MNYPDIHCIYPGPRCLLRSFENCLKLRKTEVLLSYIDRLQRQNLCGQMSQILMTMLVFLAKIKCYIVRPCRLRKAKDFYSYFWAHELYKLYICIQQYIFEFANCIQQQFLYKMKAITWNYGISIHNLHHCFNLYPEILKTWFRLRSEQAASVNLLIISSSATATCSLVSLPIPISESHYSAQAPC